MQSMKAVIVSVDKIYCICSVHCLSYLIGAVQCNFLTHIFDIVYLRFALNAQRVHLCAELIAASMMLKPL